MAVHVRNVLVLLGIIVTSAAIIYFATEFGRELSEWGRVIDLLLLSVVFISLGVDAATRGDATELVEKGGWRWLRVTNALYIIGAIAAFGTVIVFFGVGTIRPVFKVLIALAIGLALIMVAAWRFGGKPKPRA